MNESKSGNPAQRTLPGMDARGHPGRQGGCGSSKETCPVAVVFFCPLFEASAGGMRSSLLLLVAPARPRLCDVVVGVDGGTDSGAAVLQVCCISILVLVMPLSPWQSSLSSVTNIITHASKKLDKFSQAYAVGVALRGCEAPTGCG